MNGRNWYAQSCCAITGEGLREAADWLSDSHK
jgi:hypothetical protein